MGLAALPFALGYLSGALATAAWTAHLGSFGHISSTGIFTGVLSIGIHSTAGFLIGSWLPYRLTPGIATVIIYLAEILTIDHYGAQVYLLQPLLVQLVTAFWDFQEQLFTRQLVWFLAFLALLFALALRLPFKLLIALGVVASVTAIPLWQLQGRALAQGVTPFSYVCSSQTGSTNSSADLPRVCVHPAYAPALPALTERFVALKERLGSGTVNLRELDQVPRDGTKPRPGAIPFPLDRITTADLNNAVTDLVQDLLDTSRCPDDYDTDRMTAVVGDWLAGNTTALADLGIDKKITPKLYVAATAFRSWDSSPKRTWLASHWSQFTNCRVTPALVTGRP